MNPFAFGFAAVAISAVGAVDYISQAQRAGLAPGTYSAGAYVASFGERYTARRDATALAERQRARAKTHLPQAPEGWDQRVFEPAEGGANTHADLDGRILTSGEAESFLAAQSRKADRAKARKAAKAGTLEYQRGAQIVRLSATYDKPEQPEGIADLAVAMAGLGINGLGGQLRGYAVVQGVPFFRDMNIGPAQLPQDGPARLSLTAMISPQITLNVQALATEADLRALLEQVDYTALNAMLDTPLPGIGADAPAIPAAGEAVWAELALQAMRAGQSAAFEDLGARALAMVDRAAAGEAPAAADTADTVETAQGAAAKPAKPGRLKLSGGSSCLGNSAGKLCAD